MLQVIADHADRRTPRLVGRSQDSWTDPVTAGRLQLGDTTDRGGAHGVVVAKEQRAGGTVNGDVLRPVTVRGWNRQESRSDKGPTSPMTPQRECAAPTART